MIDGITILNTYTYNNLLVGIIFILGCVLFIVLAGLTFFFAANLWNDFDGKVHGFMLTLVGLIIFVFAIWIGSIGVECTRDNTTEYEVTIEDSVSFNDVMENYEIIDQNGQIWTIEVKEKGE